MTQLPKDCMLKLNFAQHLEDGDKKLMSDRHYVGLV